MKTNSGFLDGRVPVLIPCIVHHFGYESIWNENVDDIHSRKQIPANGQVRRHIAAGSGVAPNQLKPASIGLKTHVSSRPKVICQEMSVHDRHETLMRRMCPAARG